MREAQPFLKWAGGKRQLLSALVARTPARYARAAHAASPDTRAQRPDGTYFEPFVGGGALFFALRPRRAVLTDVNERLIRTYCGVRDDVERVIRLLKSYPHEEDFFYALRALDIDGAQDAEVAAWFIYLNKTGYNGLYRVNRRNRFNVPFGRYDAPTICDAENLRACADALRGVTVEVADFETAVEPARRGDFVYFDPPYAPLSATSSFTSYTSRGFGEAEQVRLRDLAARLKTRGVDLVISNSSAPVVRELYARGFSVDEIPAVRSVNSRGSSRGAVLELLIG